MGGITSDYGIEERVLGMKVELIYGWDIGRSYILNVSKTKNKNVTV